MSECDWLQCMEIWCFEIPLGVDVMTACYQSQFGCWVLWIYYWIRAIKKWNWEIAWLAVLVIWACYFLYFLKSHHLIVVFIEVVFVTELWYKYHPSHIVDGTTKYDNHLLYLSIITDVSARVVLCKWMFAAWYLYDPEHLVVPWEEKQEIRLESVVY